MTVIRLSTGHTYQFVANSVIRPVAQNMARRGLLRDSPRTGYLAVINNRDENNFVASHNNGTRWLGGWERKNPLVLNLHSDS